MTFNDSENFRVYELDILFVISVGNKCLIMIFKSSSKNHYYLLFEIQSLSMERSDVTNNSIFNKNLSKLLYSKTDVERLGDCIQ